MKITRSLPAALLLAAAATSSAQAAGYVGKPFPDFTATDAITGESFKLSELRGQVVLIKFWATW